MDPALVYLYTDTHIVVLRREQDRWTAEYNPQMMGRPLMEPLIWNATNSKPFGRSRLKNPIRALINDYIRYRRQRHIALELPPRPRSTSSA